MARQAPLVALAALLLCSSALALDTLVNRRVLEGQAGYSDIIKHLNAYELHDFDVHEPTRRVLASAGARFVTYDLHVLGRRVTLELERYDSLFSKDYEHHYLDEDHNVIKIEKALDCIYKGVVANDETARATVSLCNGMVHATVHHDSDEKEDFTIQPLDILQKETTQHVVYRHRDLQAIEKFCGVDRPGNEMVNPLVSNGHLRGLMEKADHHGHDHSHDSTTITLDKTTARRNLGTQRYVGVNVLNDFTRYKQKSFSVHQHSAQLFAVANSLYAKLGTEVIASTFKVALEITRMYTLVKSNPWTEITDSPSGPPSTSRQVRTASGEWNSNDLLNAFNDFSNEKFPVAPLNHLLTGTTFITTTIGLAFVGGTCSGSSALPGNRQQSGETQATGITDAHISSTIAHEIGHNLGSQHTNVVPPGLPSCQPTPEAIMSASSSYGFTNWEPCTVKYFTDFLSASSADCTLNPSATVYQGIPVCGDGLVQGSEQCDCIGGSCAGIDACCNGATCQLVGGANCSALDTCCSPSCSILAVDTICRAADGPCDITERCTGTSGRCPLDTFNETGTPCTTTNTGSDGRCFAKQCLSKTEECKQRGVEFPNTWNAACDNPGECTVNCGTGTPGIPPGTPPVGSCQHYVPDQIYKDGTPCTNTQACYLGTCTPFSQIPVPINPNCSNGELDQNETDLDCGGPNCFGCAAGKLCFADKDCSFPGACNKTTTVDANGYVGLGTCTTVPPPPSLDDILNSILEWFRQNPFIWGPIVGALAFMILACCCCPRGNKPPVAKVGLVQAQQSFRNMRGQGNVPDAMVVRG